MENFHMGSFTVFSIFHIYMSYVNLLNCGALHMKVLVPVKLCTPGGDKI